MFVVKPLKPLAGRDQPGATPKASLTPLQILTSRPLPTRTNEIS